MSKALVCVEWADVAHLTDQEKAEQLASIPEYQRDARTRGIPYLGAGAIYPFRPEEITVKDFKIPDHWPRGYGMDVGWKSTAAAWGAHDRDTDVLYIYSVHKRGHGEPAIHAEAIKARGAWIPGRIDPAANQRNQIDGRQLLKLYRKLGLKLTFAPNAVESGIYACTMRFGTGRLKVFASCTQFFEEYSNYSRDEHGKIVKDDDHLLDGMRYLILSLEQNANWMKVVPVAEPAKPVHLVTQGQMTNEWMSS